VGRRERLVDVVVHHVETHIARPSAPEQGVQVCPVVVEQAADVVDHRRDFGDVALEQPERVRVSQHERRGVLGESGLERLEVDPSLVVAGQGDDVVATERSTGEVGPVGALWDDDLVPMPLVVVFVVRRSDAVPTNSPAAPAGGWSVTASIPPIRPR